MEIVLEKAARRGLGSMPPKAAKALLSRLESIAANPSGQHSNIKALKGLKDTYRLRQGNWRAVYRLVFEASQMRVIVVDVRGSVYR